MNANQHPDHSAELLRLALPLMSRYSIPVTPPNYAVWYGYVAGEDEGLRAAVDRLIEGNHPITDAVCRDLHRRFVVDADEERLTKARESLRRILKNVGVSIAEADGEVSRFEQSLSGYSDRLADGPSADDLRGVLQGLTADTRSVRETGSQLHGKLDESRSEADELREELERVRREATTDALTGLANRKAFFGALERGLAGTEAGSMHCLVMLDIDHFKRVNDNYGHLVGDKVIKYVAHVLRERVKGQDTVGRYGGEEYAVFLPDTAYEAALSLAHEIRAIVEGGRLVRTGTREPIGQVTVSCGVARYRAGESIDALIERADRALYHSKNSGRNLVSGETDLEPAASGATGTIG